MKPTIALQNLIITSELTLEELKKLEKHSPNALVLKDENEEPVFGIRAGEVASVTKYGVTFNQTSAEGKAAVTVSIAGETTEEKKNFVAENYASIFANIETLEEKLSEELINMDLAIASTKASVEVVA